MVTMTSPYVKAALLTLALTLLGFFFISQLDAMRATELQNSVDQLLFQSESERFMLLYAQTMSNGSQELCSYASSTAHAKEDQAYALAEKIQYYEQSNIVNADYEKIKNDYYLSNAELYLNMRAIGKYCGSEPYRTVLFFYNATKDCPQCRAQGGVLDNLRKDYPGIRVFAFPADSGLDFVNIFVARHNITQVPSLVIDDSAVLQGLKSEADVAAYLGPAAQPNASS